MRIIAKFSSGGKPVELDMETGFVSFTMRGQIDLLKHRMDKQGRVFQQENLNGGRITKPELLEASAPTLAALLTAVVADETRLRGPVLRNSHERVVRRMNHSTGLFEFTTHGAAALAEG